MSFPTRADLKAALDSTDLPVALGAWRPGGAPDLPYLVYRAVDAGTIYADDEPLVTWTLYDVELYAPAHARDLEAEAAVEAALRAAGLLYEKSFPGDIEDQSMTETCWTTQVAGD